MSENLLQFPLNEDVLVDKTPELSDIADHIGQLIIENGVAVVQGFFNASDASVARAVTRNLLIPTIPIRAVRVAAESVLKREHTPEFLQRRPFKLHESRWRLLGSRTLGMLDEIQQFNTLLSDTEPVKQLYGDRVHALNVAVLNRFAPNEEFEKHQDGAINIGLSYAVQTSPTLWRIHKGGPGITLEPFGFNTNAGDLVVLGQRSGRLDPSRLRRYAGFGEFTTDGSPVHSGLNLTPKNRFSIALFSEQDTFDDTRAA